MNVLKLQLMPMLAQAEPFLKWAGGKRQLINQIARMLPNSWIENRPRKYVEPMVGGGALFFYLTGKYELDQTVICDINHDLILTYRAVQREPEALICELTKLKILYEQRDHEGQKILFYEVRHRYNETASLIDHNQFGDSWITRAAQLIFLNRTCFNGLYRVNASGLFNVPFGGYRNPKICDSDNIRDASAVLANTVILNGDFTLCEPYINANTLVYFDPPYRPLSKTSSFTSYSSCFDDKSQYRLAAFYRSLHNKKPILILSNSDPHNTDPKDDFFDHLYEGFYIERVLANRMINSVAEKRGPVYELLVLNYNIDDNYLT